MQYSAMSIDKDSAFSVLSQQWKCSTDGSGRGMVRGGMTFHRSSGFLELPTSGVYYVYHQVMFRTARDPSPRLARSRLVGCIPGEDCSYLEGQDQPYMQTETNLEGKYGTSKFQAGLFHFPAGAQIAVLVLNELFTRPRINPINYDDFGHNTYMGAFLVDEDRN